MFVNGNVALEAHRFESHMERVLNHSIARMVLEMQRKKMPIVLKRERLDKLRKSVPSCKGKMRALMTPDQSGRVTLDQHKLAAIAAIKILKYKPVMIKDGDGERESYRVLAFFAFFAGIDILAMYSIPPACVDTGIRSRIFEKIRPLFPYPEKIKDSGPVVASFINAFEQVAKAVPEDSIDALLWMFSSKFYWLDYFSRDYMSKLAKDLYDIEKKNLSI